MRKNLSLIKKTFAIVTMAALLFTGCGNKASDSVKEPDSSAVVTESVSKDETPVPTQADITETATPTVPPVTDTPTPTPKPEYENISNNEPGHHEYNPHFFSSMYYKEFGDKYRDTIFAMVDAVRAGEDSFACPDRETYDWCTGRLSNFFCPIMTHYCTVFDPNGGPSYENGRGYIFYTIPKEEFIEKEKAFEDEIVAVLDDCVSDDYNDFEKALALYEYMARNYTYDYEMSSDMNERMKEQSAYRCMTEKRGICNELARLYSILLMQVGVDVNNITGDVVSGLSTEGHEWNFVTIDGVSYHIDTTWALTSDLLTLGCFMMTDKLRSERDFIPLNTLAIGTKGREGFSFFNFSATDNRYEAIWETYYLGMDRSTQELVLQNNSGDQIRFKYGN